MPKLHVDLPASCDALPLAHESFVPVSTSLATQPGSGSEMSQDW